ncbi:P-loop containing nucleoside triphosphate hydrolase protein [Wallemia mellicola CBS 633.66]|uniref:p-loop containing nucleoside triphosphate hydrolase protein n=1 Tax=Wallemia mellicola (strain ATCC MYA-4683 / CBS 633.66) TaxID=671144 RepID=I4YJ44_WALMC|nr:P-loop containing nucleoside triphosphate hydrolase protein [Wallemia mellicola CBS 633.66]EIM23986.1 P-loop containing nucleoside triphosphate hydrolase protein [Wallemia mellicola CBS 633.66]|eukprot:XP_006955821.1 P-loop containing nucleoside triphosphate hydrolase protein [Wallemia mellicola CBS 633.66]
MVEKMEIDSHKSDLPWVEKYRPNELDDVVSHTEIIQTINQFIQKQRLPHLLFYGPPGTGKTSTILAIAKKIYGGNWKRNVLELNASDDRGIDVVRDQIKSFAQTRTLFSDGFKLIILDEADLMTQQAQGALRRIIEHYTPTTRFCIICNYVNKITPAIMSRCTRFRFSPLPYAHLDKRLVEVIENEAVQIDDDAKKALLNLTKGDMRRALNILQACHTACMPERISIKDVYNVTAAPQPEAIEYIVNTLLKDEISTCYSKIHQVKRQNGLALQDILTGVYDYIQTIEFPTATKVAILELLAEVEHRLSKGSSETIQLSALIASFKLSLDIAAKSA